MLNAKRRGERGASEFLRVRTLSPAVKPDSLGGFYPQWKRGTVAATRGRKENG